MINSYSRDWNCGQDFRSEIVLFVSCLEEAEDSVVSPSRGSVLDRRRKTLRRPAQDLQNYIDFE